MSKPKLLYIGIHGILEYYELKLFHKMGFEVRSIGDFTDPKNPFSPHLTNPLAELTQDLDFIYKIKRLTPQGQSVPNAKILTADITDSFDIIILCHNIDYLKNNFDLLKDKLIIWRCTGQPNPNLELEVSPYKDILKIVRWSETEKLCPNYVGGDYIIRVPVDEDLYSGDWLGHIEKVLTVKNRIYGSVGNEISKWKYITKNLPNQLAGAYNDSIPGSKANLSMEELINLFKTYRVHIALPSGIAPYNMTFFESLLSGIPTVTLGQNLVSQGLMYEQHKIIQHGISGICSDSLNELRDHIQELLKNYTLAKRIGEQGRILAKNLIGYNNIMKQWSQVFNIGTQ